MPSPIAHSLAGLTIAHALGPESLRGRVTWLGFALVAANAPDLDFLAGLVTGSINAFHGGPSHSLGAAAGFAVLVGLATASRNRARASILFWTALAIYSSHVLMDMACEPSPTRPGLPLLWPLTSEEYLFPWRPFLGIAHGGHGGLSRFLEELFSVHNLTAIGLETAVFGPPLLILYLRRGVPACLRRTPVPEASGAEAHPSPPAG